MIFRKELIIFSRVIIIKTIYNYNKNLPRILLN